MANGLRITELTTKSTTTGSEYLPLSVSGQTYKALLSVLWPGASEILSRLLTVDGPGSGLNADLIDGIDSTAIPYGGSGGARTIITDANVTKSGFYELQTPWTNGPGSWNTYIITVGTGTTYAAQIGIRSNTNQYYTRTNNNGTWGAWEKIWTASTDGTGSGLDADLLDGYNSSTTASASTIPVYGTSGVLPVGTPTANEHAATKQYVDTAAAGGGIVGFMGLWPAATAPTGWLLCQGQAISRTTYSALFTAIGTVWGVGDGSTTFNLPDMRESAPVGVGTYAAVTGTTHGTITAHDSFTLAQSKDDQIQGHFHSISTAGTGLGSGTYTYGPAASGLTTVYTGAPSTDGTNGTPRTGTVTRGKGIGLNFIIKY